MKRMMIIGLSVVGVAITGCAEAADADTQAKEQAVKTLMDEFVEKGLPYKVEPFTAIAGYRERRIVRHEHYTITLPDDVAERVRSLDMQVKEKMLLDYLDKEEYSFYAAVLLVESCGKHFAPDIETQVRDFRLPEKKHDMFDGIVKTDKKLWDAQREKTREKFIYSYHRAMNRKYIEELKNKEQTGGTQ